MRRKSAIQRVDLQVALLVAVMVAISSTIVFYFSYAYTYEKIIATLEDRVNSIALYVESKLKPSIFTDVTVAEDMDTEMYREAQAFLSDIREATSTKYLYTATRNEHGELIYHIDGLPEEDKDFRKPGDLIEPMFQKDLNLALSNVIVMPETIKNSEWGDVFVAYFPLHNRENTSVMGAIGIEFPASNEYQAIKQIRIMTPFVIIFTCIASIIISRLLFRRISNPHFKDLSNTDSLTGLKNRNAYDLDIENLIQSNRVKKYALILADLNALKVVNDQYGHKLGDEYIKHFALALHSKDSSNNVAYRIGGDEFAIFFYDPTEKEVQDYIQQVKKTLKDQAMANIPFCSVAVGYAFSDALTHESWEQTQINADIALYKDKKQFYANNQRFDNRKIYKPVQN